MSAISPRECFNFIDSAVQKQTNRLLIPIGSSERSKGQEILHALDRLFLATIEKHPQGVAIRHRFTVLTKIDRKQIIKVDLATVNAMLDAEISMWESEIEPWTEQGMEFNGRRAGYSKQISLRTALNISRNNIFNSVKGTWGPLWGKTKALEEVEKELEL